MNPARMGDPTRRFRGLTLRMAALLIGLIACGLGAYQYHERHVKRLTIAYPIADLLPRGRPSRSIGDFEPLVDSIRAEVLPGSWRGQGGSGTIVEFFLNDSLIVNNSRVGHERLAAYLQRKRSAR